ncbi:MAG: T9SS type B sorting domain-containing protein [Psychroflexus sp.]
MKSAQKHSSWESGIKGKITFYSCLAMFFCVYLSSAQDQIICDSEFNFFGVDMDENNGNGSTNSTYEWSVFENEFDGEIIPQTPSSNQIIIEWDNTPAGKYTILVQEVNSNFVCESDPQQMVIDLKDLFPEDILGPDFVCEGETIELNHPFSENGNWTLENENIGNIDQNGNFVGLETGYVIVNFSYLNNGCEFLVSKLIQVQPKPQPKLQGQEICIDRDGKEIVVLDSGLSQENHVFEWYHNDQLLSISQNHISVSDTGEYKLQVLNSQTGCVSEVITTKVTEFPRPSISADVNTDFHDNQRIVVNIENPQNYLFKLGDGEFQDNHIFQNVTTEGLHYISIIEKEGCFSKEIEVTVINYPKFFTPNDDGTNDTWNIESLKDDPTAQIFIFDRYGKFIKTITPASKGWDGIYNGKRMPTDDYWFRVEYTDRNDGSQRTFRSNFTLKR